MVNPFADAKKQARSTAEAAALDFCEVVEVQSNAGHTARVSIKGDRGNSRVVSAIVPTDGDVSVPQKGDIVAVGYAKGNKPVVLGTVYTADDDIPQYEAGERVLGAPGTSAQIKFNADGSIDIDGADGAAIRTNGTNVSGGYTDEQARDAIGTALTAGTGINITVDDPNDTITIDSTISTYTDEDARDAIGTALVGGNLITITVNDAGDTITLDVDPIDPADLNFDPATQSELDTHSGNASAHHAKYTDEEAQDSVGSILSADFTYDDAGNAINMNPHKADSDAHHTKTTSQSELTDFSSAAENIYVQDTEPASPSENDIWIDTTGL